MQGKLNKIVISVTTYISKDLGDNQIRNYGYLLLSLAHMPHLNWIGMSIQNFSDHSLNDERMKVRGFQWLLKSDWVKSVGY